MTDERKEKENRRGVGRKGKIILWDVIEILFQENMERWKGDEEIWIDLNRGTNIKKQE